MGCRGLRREALQSRGAQFQNELCRVDHVGAISSEREKHETARLEPSEGKGRDIGRVQRQNEHAEHVFPKEGWREEIAAENRLFPDRTGDHDGIERQRLDDDRGFRCRFPISSGEEAQDEPQAYEKDEELDRREDALNEGPPGPVTANSLLSRVKRLGQFRVKAIIGHSLSQHRSPGSAQCDTEEKR